MAEKSHDTPRKPLNKVAPPEDTSDPEVYVIRLPEPSRRFAWEIRCLSAVVLERSGTDFTTVDSARADGRSALEALMTAGQPARGRDVV